MAILAEKRARSEIDLRKLMKKMGIRTNAFAELCGISTQSLAQFLRPGKSLTTNTIYRIANALDIDPRDMFFPVDEEVFNEKNTAEPKTEIEDKLEESPQEENQPQNNNLQNTTAPLFQIHTAICPSCGKQVRVGVVLLSES